MSGMTESVRRAWVTGCCALSGVDRSAFTEHEKLFDRSLASSGEYRIIDRFIHQDDLVFDVGANVGLWSHYVLQRKKVGALYAFEPTNEVAEQLKQHIAGPDNVYCMNMAVTDQDGRANLTCYACSSHNSVFQRPYSHAPEGDRGVRTVTSVPTVSLDSFCHKYDIQQINFLKIDTEGAEQLVLNGAKGLLRKIELGSYNSNTTPAGAWLVCVWQMFTMASDHMATALPVYPGVVYRFCQSGRKVWRPIPMQTIWL